MPLACYAIRVLHQAPWHLLGRVLRGTAHSTALAHLQLLAQLRDAVPVDVLDLQQCSRHSATVSSRWPHGVRLQYPVSTSAVPCEYLGAPCALRRGALCGACVPSHTRSAAIRTHARSAAACVARDCVVCCAHTRAGRAPTRTAVSAARYLLQPVDRRAVRLALPCELPLRRAEDLAEPEPHFVHHLRRGEPKCHSVPVPAAGSFQTAAARP